jgi:hypothetical protein
MEFLVGDDIGTSELVLSTKLEGYSVLLWAELSIWAAVMFSSFWGADLETTLPTKIAFFYQHSIPVQSSIFGKMVSRHNKVSL